MIGFLIALRVSLALALPLGVGTFAALDYHKTGEIQPWHFVVMVLALATSVLGQAKIDDALDDRRDRT